MNIPYQRIFIFMLALSFFINMNSLFSADRKIKKNKSAIDNTSKIISSEGNQSINRERNESTYKRDITDIDKHDNKLIKLDDDEILLEYELNNLFIEIRKLHSRKRFSEIESIIKNINKKYKIMSIKEYFYYMGVINEHKSEYRKAIENYEKAIALYPTYSKAMNTLGGLYCKFQKYNLALKYYKKALQCNPYNPFIQYNIGSLYYEIGDFDKSILHLNNSIKYKANFASAYHRVGIIMFKKNDFEDALENFNKAIKFNKKTHITFYYLGLCCYRLKKDDNAISNLKKALQIKKDFYEALVELGKIYQSYGEFANAITMYKKAESLNSDCIDLKLWITECYAALRRYSKAVDIIKKLIKEEPENKKLKQLQKKYQKGRLTENLNEPVKSYKY